MTLFQAVTKHNINGVLFSMATAQHITLNFLVERLIFPVRKALTHVIF